MSHHEADWAYKLPIKDRTAKLVFAQLCDAWSADKGCYPTVERLCQRTASSRRAVQRALSQLEKDGRIQRQFTGRATHYTINFDGASEAPQRRIGTGVAVAHQRRHSSNEIGQDGASEASSFGTLTHRTQLRELKELTPVPPLEDLNGKQTNGHDVTPLGLGILTAETERPDPANGRDRCACDSAKDAWNATAERCGWPRVQRFTPSRAKATQARLAEIGGLPEWQKMLGKMEASPFFRERWQPVFDWILKPTNLTKVLEGNYDNRGPPNRDAEIEAALARSRK